MITSEWRSIFVRTYYQHRSNYTTSKHSHRTKGPTAMGLARWPLLYMCTYPHTALQRSPPGWVFDEALEYSASLIIIWSIYSVYTNSTIGTRTRMNVRSIHRKSSLHIYLALVVKFMPSRSSTRARIRFGFCACNMGCILPSRGYTKRDALLG